MGRDREIVFELYEKFISYCMGYPNFERHFYTSRANIGQYKRVQRGNNNHSLNMNRVPIEKM